jgi:hypothetical protein
LTITGLEPFFLGRRFRNLEIPSATEFSAGQASFPLSDCFGIVAIREENITMHIRTIALSVGLSIFAFGMPCRALADDLLTDTINEFLTDHLDEAISHTKQAIKNGNVGELDTFLTQSHLALSHAEAIVEKLDYNADIIHAISHLKAAIRAGAKHHLKAATSHASDALSQLERTLQ